jgi:hypothetical protein
MFSPETLTPVTTATRAAEETPFLPGLRGRSLLSPENPYGLHTGLVV